MVWTCIIFAWMAVATGLVFTAVPPAEGVGYWVRILFFHIPTAWIMVLGFLLAAWWAFRYLRTKNLQLYQKSAVSAELGFLFCIAATVSGSIYAKFTWGSFWNWDVRETTIFILLLIYGAYVTLERAVADEEKRARISSVYLLLAFITVPFLVFILPRLYWSLHPADTILNTTGKIHMETSMILTLVVSLIGITGLFFWLLHRSLKRRAKKAQDSGMEDESV